MAEGPAAADPYPGYRWLRDHDPVHWEPAQGVWLASSYGATRAVLRDERFSAELGQQSRHRDRDLPASMLTTDGPEHRRLRRAAARALQPDVLASLRDHARDTARQLADVAGQGSVDVLSRFARPLTVAILAALLEVPEPQRDRFAAFLAAAAPAVDPFVSGERERAADRAAAQLHELLASELSTSSLAPQGFLRGLGDEWRRGQILLGEAATTATLMAVGGYEPLVHAIGNGLLALLRQPEVLERLAAGAADAAHVTDEVLRHDPSVPFVARVTTADVHLGGRTIPPRSTVVALLAAANRDPDAFAHPDMIMLDGVSNRHLSFGAGPHACLAAPIARSVVEVALVELAVRRPRLAVPQADLEWQPTLVPRALRRLPIRFEPLSADPPPQVAASGEPHAGDGTTIVRLEDLAGRLRQGQGDALLWIHGYSLDSSAWVELWDHLPGWNHVAVDLPGHGRSRAVTPTEGMREITEKLGRIAADHDVRHIVGMSFGAIFAAALAARMGTSVRSLVLGSPALAGGPSDGSVRSRYEAMRRTYQASGLDPEIARTWLDSEIFRHARENPVLADRLATMINAHSWEELGGPTVYSAPPDGSARAELARIGCRSLIIVGEDEMAAFRRTAEIIRRAVPDCVRTYVPGAGHLCLLEAPGPCAALIDRHLRSNALVAPGRAR